MMRPVAAAESNPSAAGAAASSARAEPMLFSIVIPAHNEEDNLGPTVEELVRLLDLERIPHEIVVVDDNSSDLTGATAQELATRFRQLRIVTRRRMPGFGRAVRAGLETIRGDAVTIVMADRSDDPHDVVRYYRKLEEGYDCVFGSRFRSGSRVEHYPRGKLFVNRIVNHAIRWLFWTRFNDLTNAFKAYRTEVIRACGPYSSSHFNLIIEMSLSALIRRYHIAEIPISWYGRTWGASKLSLFEMGRRYLVVVLKMFFDKLLIGDDILEERLVARNRSEERMRELEARVERVETGLESLAGAKAIPGTSAGGVPAKR
jgi:dolichol-phosphate mannosyltransferase